ncbi:MAG: hypothetical protein JWR27_1997 [Aeromicrobium sp.]|jgi:hypothetical protein|nr:hypothetical protein [Aeromicrobium sp.]
MTNNDSAARNPEHEDDAIDRAVTDQPDIGAASWVKRIVLAIVLLGVAYIVFRLSAAYFPRWWGHRIGDQVDGKLSRGTLLGVFYGFVFTVVPLLLLFQIRRGFFSWTWRGIVAIVALVLAAPNWLTLAVVAGNSKAAHAGERTFDVEAPGFRAGTLGGAICGVLLALLITGLSMRLKGRRNEVRRLREERDALKRERQPHDESE